ncbi:DegV family protein [Mesomycoplasma lagogenitalium]|uniref:DegV family protein n=1 Tax=Mesomycoplasma lagogenitalium TaxID=171286 RepID=A0ABY8LSX0_9BACT|nr:DegV family protein [Mesomycoplasma lagogenitalium]WGI36347.1 DegV family protein [Mesomycoplasma lagogenitalium]
MKIAIIVDSASGLTKQMCADMGIYFLPLYINIGGKEYEDGIDLNSGEVLKYIDKDSQVSTSMTPVGKAIEVVDQLVKKYDKVVIYPISHNLSSQYANLKSTFASYKNVDIVKSKKLTLLTVLDIIRFKKDIENGVDYQVAFSKLEKEYEGKFLLVPKFNDALVRGGRLSPSVAAIAKLLKIVPVIKLEDGSLQKEGKGRIFRKALFNFYKDTIDSLPKNYKTVIIHSGNKEIEEIKNEFENYSSQKIEVFTIPNTIAIHTGVEAVAFGVLNIEQNEIDEFIKIFKK